VPSVPAVWAALAPLRAAEDRRVFRRDAYVDVAIDLPTGREEEEVIESIVSQLAQVSSLLAAAGLTSAGAPDDPASSDDDPDE
jgi:hypothetical protein